MTDEQVAIRHDEGNRRFVADVDGTDSGAFMSYRVLDDRTLDYYSTFTPEELRGRGIARRVVTAALDHAVDGGFRVVPTCPYVARLITRNPRYAGVEASR